MTKRKKSVWLCVLAAVAICAAVWLWPRSMGAVAGMGIEEVVGWNAVTQEEGLSLGASSQGGQITVTPDQTGREELLGEWYTFRFSRPVYTSTLYFKAELYEMGLIDKTGHVVHFTVLSDGTLWGNKWRYELVGGQTELERLNRWLADAAA